MNNVILKQIKRVLSVVLAIVLIVGLIPRSAYSVYAQEVADEQTENSDYDESVEQEILDEQGEAEEDVSDDATEDAETAEISGKADASGITDDIENTENAENTGEDEIIEEAEELEGAEEIEKTEETEEAEELALEEDVLGSDEMELFAASDEPRIDTTYGEFKGIGIEEDFENDVMSIKFKLKTNYKNISLNSGEELWLYYRFGATKPIIENRDKPDSSKPPFYRFDGAEKVDINSDENIIKIDVFSPRVEYNGPIDILLQYFAVSNYNGSTDIVSYITNKGNASNVRSVGYHPDGEHSIEYTPSTAPKYFITFDANGGVFESRDAKAVKSNSSSGTSMTYTSQSFNYINVSSDKFIADTAASVYDFAPVREGYTFAGWESENDGSDYPEYFSSKEEDRKYRAKWNPDIESSPAIDTNRGMGGIEYKYDSGKVSTSLRIPKDNYSGIDVGSGNALWLNYTIGSTIPFIGNDSNKDSDGFYRVSDSLKVDKNADKIDIDKIIFSSIPNSAGKISFSLQYFLVPSSVTSIDPDSRDIIKKSKCTSSIINMPAFAELKYMKDEVSAKISLSGSDCIKFCDKTDTGENFDTDEVYAFDSTKTYRLTVEAKDGYKFSKTEYFATNSLNPALWTTSTKDFKPGSGSSIVAIAKPVYSPVIDGAGDPDGAGVYKVTYLDEITCKIKKANTVISPSKIVIRNDTKTLLEFTENKFSFSEIREAYAKKVAVDLYDEDTKVCTVTIKVSSPINSVTLKNRAVLSPVIGGSELTSAITVNTGADIGNLAYKFYKVEDGIIKTDDSVKADAEKYVEVSISDGILKVRAEADYAAGNKVNLLLYDSSNNKKQPSEQEFTKNNNRFVITTTAPSWTKKTPTASLINANDIKLDFMVAAPSGVTLDENYWFAVTLSENKKTPKPIKNDEENELTISNTTKYFQIGSDGTVPAVVLYPFLKDNVRVEELGKGAGVSMDAQVSLLWIREDGNPSNPNDILAQSAVKKLTVATKTPYYADKITLKKTADASKLYADGTTKTVATIDFGKNTTYTGSDYWTIENVDELAEKNIIAEREGNYLKIRVAEAAKAGTYKINVATKPPSGGIPARASVDIKVLPTAKSVDASPVTIYHVNNKAVSYTVKPTVLSQDGAVIKNASLTYEIGEETGTQIVSVAGLTIDKKGVIKVAKTYDGGPQTYKMRITATCGSTVKSELITVKVVENSINPKVFKFGNPGNAIEGGQPTISMTLQEYFDLGWNKSNLSNAPATLGINDLDSVGVSIVNDNNGQIEKDLLKEVKIPNPCFIKKSGKITLSATAIDGRKLTQNINIIKDSDTEFAKLYLQGGKKTSATIVSESEAVNLDGSGTNAIYTVWLGTDGNLGEQIITKEDISGEKLTFKGAKIINNYHDDYIEFVMTAKTATITRTKGKSKTTYTLTNNNFSNTLKAAAVKGEKIYTNYGYSQKIHYLLNGNVTPGETATGGVVAELSTTNKNLKNYIDNITAEYESSSDSTSQSEKLTFTVPSNVSEGLKAGSYPITVQLKNGDTYLCKPFSVTLKLENLKKSFKLTKSYKMLKNNTEPVNLLCSQTNCDGIIEELGKPKLLNDNVKGKYNNIADILTIKKSEGIYSIDLISGKELPSDKKSLTGYIEYSVKYIDGSTEYHLEKITVNLK